MPSCATSVIPSKAMFRTENALILREVRFRESDRILTALTADAGKMTLAAHGALSKKSKIAAATQLLTYSELTLFEKNGRFAVREGITKEAFSGLRKDLKRFALGCYFAECLEQYAAEEQPEPELMQLGLNCLYALSEELRDSETVKSAFELRGLRTGGHPGADVQSRRRADCLPRLPENRRRTPADRIRAGSPAPCDSRSAQTDAGFSASERGRGKAGCSGRSLAAALFGTEFSDSDVLQKPVRKQWKSLLSP